MNAETSIEKPVFGLDHWIGFICGIGIIAIIFAGFWYFRFRDAPLDLILRDSTVQLSVDSMRVFSLRLPRSGTLEIEAFTAEDSPFSVYLATRPGAEPRKASELRLLTTFTAEGISHYRRSAWIERGEYHLTLIKLNSPHGAAPAAQARLRARLKARVPPRRYEL